MAARHVRDVEAPGSNPGIPTIRSPMTWGSVASGPRPAANAHRLFTYRDTASVERAAAAAVFAVVERSMRCTRRATKKRRGHEGACPRLGRLFVWALPDQSAILLEAISQEDSPCLDPGLRPGSVHTVGAVVVSRQPRNTVGWLCCTAGLFGALTGFAAEYAGYALGPQQGLLPGGVAMAWLNFWLTWARPAPQPARDRKRRDDP